MNTKHPRALPFLFLTEMWERFGFYVVQGLLVLYMTKYYNLTDNQSFTISGIFGGLVYISPFLGGLIADRYLGFSTTIIWGGLFLVLGYALLSLSIHPDFLYPALATIIVGNGLLKPNISSLLGTQYENHDPNRDAGFTIFYIGINIGVLLSAFSGYIRDAFGWQVTYACASVGMLIGLGFFLYGIQYLKDATEQHASFKTKCYLFLGCLLSILGISFLFHISALTNFLMPCVGILLLVFLIVLTLKQNPENQKRMTLLIILTLASTIFWMLFFQMFNSANLYIERLVNKNLFGLELNTTIFYASESVYIILLGPLFALLWQALGRHQPNPEPVGKFVLGILFAGLAFLTMSMSAQFVDSNGLVNPLWIFFAYLLLTLGELFLSPIGLSAFTKLAPPHLSGMMMGIWFISLGFGSLFAGWIAKLSSVPDELATVPEKLAIYHHAFMDYAWIGFAATFILIIVQFIMKTRLKQGGQV